MRWGKTLILGFLGPFLPLFWRGSVVAIPPDKVEASVTRNIVEGDAKGLSVIYTVVDISQPLVQGDFAARLIDEGLAHHVDGVSGYAHFSQAVYELCIRDPVAAICISLEPPEFKGFEDV